MKSIRVHRFVLGFVLAVQFVVGVQVMTPDSYAYGCSQNGQQGGCGKQAPTEPETEGPSAPSSFEGVLNQFGIALDVLNTMF
jgi:hypothetical protein